MFGWKKKKAKGEDGPQLSLEESVENKTRNLQAQLMKLQKKERELAGQLKTYHGHGIAAQEEAARAMLRRCLAFKKRVLGMIATIELAVQARDLAALSKEFTECLSEVSRDLMASASKTDVKKAERDSMRAIYASTMQQEKMDRLLEAVCTDYQAASDGGKYAEFDAEIDKLLQDTDAAAGEFGKLY